ncbi:MAG TPA: Crp/Fnr family transcriptional regulator [Trichocoleus sp.]
MAAINFILDSLPEAEYEWLRPQLEEVELQQSTILCPVKEPIQEVYFPITCLLSWLNFTEMGEVVEAGVTGNEGVTGVTLLLNEPISPWQTEVQLPGVAFKLSAEAFMSALDRSVALRQRVAAFAYLKMVQLCQSAVCNRFHNVQERLCRWLLVAADHAGGAQFALTQDILAQMIGAGRPTVSLTTGTLQSADLIRTNRGGITILNRAGLEATSCECYQILQQALNHYLSQKIKS